MNITKNGEKEDFGSTHKNSKNLRIKKIKNFYISFLFLTMVLALAISISALPEDCKKEKTNSGLEEVECEFDKEEFEEFDIKKKKENCEGKFEIKNGEPVCTVEGKSGLTQSQCPSEKELENMKNKCQGEVKEFTDDSGCKAIECVDKDFKEKYDKAVEEKYEGVKEEAIKCGKNGGSLIEMNNQTKCVGEGKTTVKKPGEEEEKKGPDKIDKLAAEDFERIIQKFEDLQEKLDELTKKFKKKRNKSEVFRVGYYDLQAVKVKIRNFKSQVSGKGEGFDKDIQEDMLNKFEDIKNTISETTEAVVNGKVPEKDDMLENKFKKQKKYYAGSFESRQKFKEKVEKEKDMLEKIRNCHNYEEPESFVPPVPEKAEIQVNKAEIVYKNGSCKTTLYLGEGSTTFLLDGKTYTDFQNLRNIPDKSCTKNCKLLEKTGDERTEGEKCIEECVTRDCDKGVLQCLEINKKKCEEECGMTGEEGEMDAEAECIQKCMKEKGMGDMECEPGEGDKGEQNPYCLECTDKCVGEYYKNTPCILSEEVKKKEEECRESGEYMYAEQIKGDSGKDGECVVEVECKSAESEFGDNASGSAITGAITGGASKTKEFFSKIGNWFENLFSGGKEETPGSVNETSDNKTGEKEDKEDGKEKGNISKKEAKKTVKDLEEINKDIQEIEGILK